MADVQYIENNLEALASAVSIEDIAPIIRDLRGRYGFASLTYRSLRKSDVGQISSGTVISTADPEWLKQYDEQDLVSADPIVKSTWQAPLPLDWDFVDRRSKSARLYFQEMKRFKIGDRGLTIPLTPPNRPSGLFTFTSDGIGDLEWKALKRRSEADMILFGHYIHFHALRLDQTSRTEEVLTERGRICLELVLTGHKPTLIGKLLGLSVHTVRMHLRHAQERLQCHSLPEAVVRALELGIISKTARLVLVGAITQLIGRNFFAETWTELLVG